MPLAPAWNLSNGRSNGKVSALVHPATGLASLTGSSSNTPMALAVRAAPRCSTEPVFVARTAAATQHALIHPSNVSSTCPPLLQRFMPPDPGHAARICCDTSPVQRAIMASLTLATCDRLHLTPTDLLVALRGKTLVMVGDSTMKQLWDDLLVALFDVAYETNITRITDELPSAYGFDEACMLRATSRHTTRQLQRQLTFRLQRQAACTVVADVPAAPIAQPAQLPPCREVPTEDVSMALRAGGERTILRYYQVGSLLPRSAAETRPQTKWVPNRTAWHGEVDGYCSYPEGLAEDHGGAGWLSTALSGLRDAFVRSDVIVANVGMHYHRVGAPAYRYDVRALLSMLHEVSAGSSRLGLFRESTPQVC